METQRAEIEVAIALQRTLAAQRSGINERMLAQLRVAENLRIYVSWLLAGSLVVLVGLFGFYRWAKSRESAAAKRIERVLWNDPATGVMRHADAGYEDAIACAREQGLDLPMLR